MQREEFDGAIPIVTIIRERTNSITPTTAEIDLAVQLSAGILKQDRSRPQERFDRG